MCRSIANAAVEEGGRNPFLSLVRRSAANEEEEEDLLLSTRSANDAEEKERGKRGTGLFLFLVCRSIANAAVEGGRKRPFSLFSLPISRERRRCRRRRKRRGFFSLFGDQSRMERKRKKEEREGKVSSRFSSPISREYRRRRKKEKIFFSLRFVDQPRIIRRTHHQRNDR